jgi:predicted PurR-regulated permease PerM
MFFAFLFAGISKTINETVKNEFESKLSEEKDELAILWALALLARAVNRTLVAEDTEFLAKQTSIVLEQFEIIDSLTQQEFLQMMKDFNQTKVDILASIEKSREKIRQNIDNLKSQLIGHVMNAVESTKELHFSYLNNAFEIVRTFFSVTSNALATHAVLFFMFFQVILFFGILFYHKFERQMTLFLT